MKLPERYRNFQMVQARGDFKEADKVEKKLLDSINLESTIELHDSEETIFRCIMLQLSLKQGLKRWGNCREENTIKKMTQMHDMHAFFPRDVKTLTREQRIKALSSLIFLK